LFYPCSSHLILLLIYYFHHNSYNKLIYFFFQNIEPGDLKGIKCSPDEIRYVVLLVSWCCDILSVEAFDMTFCPTVNYVSHNVIWATQQTELFVYCRYHTHEMLDVACFTAFFEASDVISSILSIPNKSSCRKHPEIHDGIMVDFMCCPFKKKLNCLFS